ncbi:MAG: ABC transporter ATP-binding protein [Chloroflexota bacterium]
MNEALAVETRNLRYAYPDGHLALRGIDLAVRQGEKVALVGPNGAGKSTFLLHLNGILRGQGLLRIMGLEASDGHMARLRALVGLVFQDPDDQLFSPTVLEDVAFGPIYMGLPKEQVMDRVRKALDQVRLAGYEKRMPHHLSSGEKKRVALATVLSMEPAVLALDEPSAGLDPRTRRSLIVLLQSLRQTMLVATHDILLVRDLCARMVIMDAGQVVADGPIDALLQDSALLERHGLEHFPITGGLRQVF